MADDQVVTNIVARADFSDLIANVRKVTTSLAAMQQQIGSSNKVLSAQINAVNRSFGETLRSTGQFSSHFVSLANDVDVFGKSDLSCLSFWLLFVNDHQQRSAERVSSSAASEV